MGHQAQTSTGMLHNVTGERNARIELMLRAVL